MSTPNFQSDLQALRDLINLSKEGTRADIENTAALERLAETFAVLAPPSKGEPADPRLDLFPDLPADIKALRDALAASGFPVLERAIEGLEELKTKRVQLIRERILGHANRPPPGEPPYSLMARELKCTEAALKEVQDKYVTLRHETRAEFQPPTATQTSRLPPDTWIVAWDEAAKAPMMFRPGELTRADGLERPYITGFRAFVPTPGPTGIELRPIPFPPNEVAPLGLPPEKKP